MIKGFFMYSLLVKTLFFLFFSSYAFAGTYSGNVFDDVDTNISSGISSNFANTINEQKVNFDSRNVTTSKLQDDYGVSHYKDLNLSSSTSQRQLINIFAKKSVSIGSSNIDTISKKDLDLSNYKTTNVKNLQNKNLHSFYKNPKRIRNLQKAEDSITSLMNVFSSNNTIKCYIKRNLVPSFYCPMNGKSNSYFTGGSANTSNKDALKKCNNYCRVKSTCVSRRIGSLTNKEKTYSFHAQAPLRRSFSVSGKQILDKIKIKLDGGSKNSFVYFSVSGSLGNKTVDIFENYKAKLNGGETEIILPISSRNFTSLSISFSLPFTYKYSIKNRKGISEKLVVDSVTLYYEDDKYWFCPSSQFVKKREECFGGEIQSMVIGGNAQLLCIREEDRQRESTLGAYYSKESCENSCYEVEDCLPTYKNLSNGLTSSVYNVNYGCLSGDNNKACTKKLCKEKILSNTIPNKETVFYNNNQSEVTVLNKQNVEGTLRPVYNLSAELNTNNKPKEKKILLVAMSKDKAYRSMLANNTYSISANILNKEYEELSSATKINSNGVSIKYIPRSFLFNSGKKSYVYFIAKTKYTYIEDNSYNIDGSSDTFRSENYGIVDSNRKFHLFFVKDKTEVYNTVTNSFGVYSQHKEISKTVGSNGTLSLYDVNSIAPYTDSFIFTSNKYKYDYLLSNSYLSDASKLDGTSIKNQQAANGEVKKYYSGSSTNSGGTIYSYDLFLITSATKLTYKDIISRIKNKSIKQVYSNSFPRAYTKKISGDANVKFNNKNIKLFILGKPNKMSVIGELTPSYNEENKEAFVFNFLYSEK